MSGSTSTYLPVPLWDEGEFRSNESEYNIQSNIMRQSASVKWAHKLSNMQEAFTFSLPSYFLLPVHEEKKEIKQIRSCEIFNLFSDSASIVIIFCNISSFCSSRVAYLWGHIVNKKYIYCKSHLFSSPSFSTVNLNSNF